MNLDEDYDEKNVDFPTILETLDIGDTSSSVRKKPAKLKGWPALGLDKSLLNALKKKGYNQPTPIQKKAIPSALQKRDIVAMARTGSGKTAAFLLPLIQQLHSHSARVGCRAVVLSPTRELATQTYGFLRQFSKFTDLRSSLIVGGESLEYQFAELARNPDVLIATPGRLLHLMLEVGWTLSLLEILVFDEADRMFEMGFEDQIREIMAKIPGGHARQTMLFSATLPTRVAEFAKAGLTDPVVIRLDTETSLSPLLQLSFLAIRSHERVAALVHLLTHHIPDGQPTLVFVATHQHVEFLHRLLRELRIPTLALYGKLDPEARKIAVSAFKKGKCSVMIVTDVAARGVDIPALDNVINFHFPAKEKLFVHRVGRVARAGRPGHAYSLFTRDEFSYVIDLHLFLGRPLKPAAQHLAAAEAQEQQGDPADGYYGRVPGVLLEDAVEAVERLVQSSVELEGLHRAAQNSNKAYKQTLTGPSSESIRRMKQTPLDQPHPYFAQPQEGYSLDQEAARSDLMTAISKFRPAQTIMEVQARVKGSTVDRSVMIQKRAAHEKLLTRNRQTLHDEFSSENDVHTIKDDETLSSSSSSSSSIMLSSSSVLKQSNPIQSSTKKRLSAAEKRQMKKRTQPSSDDLKAPESKKQRTAPKKVVVEPMFATQSESYFQKEIKEHALSLSDNRRAPASERIEDVILDLLPEDAQDIMKQHRGMRWDARKKRFVQFTGSTHAPGKRYGVDESGKKIELSDKKFKPKRYAEWKEATRQHIPVEGDTEHHGSNQRSSKDSIPLHLRKRWHDPKAPSTTGAGKSDIRTAQQLKKELKKKELLKLKQKPGWKKKLATQRKREHQQKLERLQRPKGSSKSSVFIRRKVSKK